MRHLPFCLLATFLCTCGPAPSTPPTETLTSTDQAAAQQLIQDAFDHIWSSTDTANVGRYHTEDFVILEHGEVWTNDTIRNWQLRQAATRRPDAPRRLNSFTFFRTEPAGEDIWLAYHNQAHFVNAAGDTVGTMGWLESAVATRTAEGWKLRMMHSTRKARE